MPTTPLHGTASSLGGYFWIRGSPGGTGDAAAPHRALGAGLAARAAGSCQAELAQLHLCFQEDLWTLCGFGCLLLSGYLEGRSTQ